MSDLIQVFCITSYGDGDYVGFVLLPNTPLVYGGMMPVGTYEQIREQFGWPPSPCGGLASPQEN